MSRAWMTTKLVAIATLVSVLAAAPGGACDVRPDENLTGGAASIRTRERIAACGHAKDNRGQMTRERHDEVLKRYGLPPGTHPDYEIDHLIPLCLGGSDDPSNLWPQPKRRIEATWNAEAKDRLEGKICKMVCAGQINEISTAQEDFASDWITAYQKYYKGRSIPPPPGPAPCTPPVGNELPTEAETADHCPSDTVVWVNLTSKIYHFKTSRFYENTKNGEYMCEGDAAAAGMRPAKNETHP
jgi:hypothetical protein